MENNQQLLEKLSLKEASLESEILKACCNNNTEKVCILLNSKPREIDVKQINRNGSLIIAIANGNVKIVEELLKIGCNPNVTNLTKDPALFIASLTGNIQILHLLLQYGANIGYADALIIAILRGNADVVEKILEFGVNLNEVEDAIPPKERGKSALNLAIDRKNLRIVRLLLQHDADPNYMDEIGNSPIHFAVQKEHIEIVKQLLKYGAEVDGKSLLDSTPLEYAWLLEQMDIAKILLDHGADVDFCWGGDRSTALHGAATYGNLENVEFLLEHNANINIRDEEGKTALEIAMEMNNVKVTKIITFHESF